MTDFETGVESPDDAPVFTPTPQDAAQADITQDPAAAAIMSAIAAAAGGGGGIPDGAAGGQFVPTDPPMPVVPGSDTSGSPQDFPSGGAAARPPSAPGGARGLGSRRSSGIGGRSAPQWEDVQKELRQNTLTDFLRRMYDTLCQQNAALEKLNDGQMRCAQELKILHISTEQQNDNWATQQEEMEKSTMDRIEKIESDLGMQRDRAGQIENNLSEGQLKVDELTNDVTKSFFQDSIEKRTLRQTVDELAVQHNKLCNVVRRERYGRLRVTGWMLADLNLKGVCRRFFSKWQTWTKMGKELRDAHEGRESMAMVALTDIRRSLHRRYFKKLMGFVQWARSQHKKADRYYKAIRCLNYTRSKHLLARYFGKLAQYLKDEDQRREENFKINLKKAEMTEEISVNALMTRYFNKLLGKRNLRVELKKKGELCHRMGGICLTTLRNRYFERLSAFMLWRKYKRKRVQLSIDLCRKNEDALRRTHLELWTQHAAYARRQLERIAVSRALATKNDQLVRREHYHALARYQKLTAQARDAHELENRFSEAQRKTDNLGTQIDVGLKTLSNTNSVLNKLVDRLISVDQQLGTLDKEKVGRRELGFITDPAKHPELLDQPPSPPKRMTETHDPRTSPAAEDLPLANYVPASLDNISARQRIMEEERERDALLEQQQAEEMARRHQELDRIAAAVAATTARGGAGGGGPGGYLHTPTHDGSSGVNARGAPMVTPPTTIPRGGTPSTQSGVDDFAAQLNAEFERELAAQRASYRNISDVTAGRFF